MWLYAPFLVGSVSAVITVVSASLRTFTVSCISFGGRALNITVTGPSGMVTTGPITSVPTSTPMGYGRDSFLATTETLTGGSNGDTYQCTASNGVATDPTDDVVLKGTRFVMDVR